MKKESNCSHLCVLPRWLIVISQDMNAIITFRNARLVLRLLVVIQYHWLRRLQRHWWWNEWMNITFVLMEASISQWCNGQHRRSDKRITGERYSSALSIYRNIGSVDLSLWQFLHVPTYRSRSSLNKSLEITDFRYNGASLSVSWGHKIRHIESALVVTNAVRLRINFDRFGGRKSHQTVPCDRLTF